VAQEERLQKRASFDKGGTLTTQRRPTEGGRDHCDRMEQGRGENVETPAASLLGYLSRTGKRLCVERIQGAVRRIAWASRADGRRRKRPRSSLRPLKKSSPLGPTGGLPLYCCTHLTTWTPIPSVESSSWPALPPSLLKLLFGSAPPPEFPRC
jgi:hypothetical protein